MPESPECFRNELLCPDNSGIGEVSCSVGETVSSCQFVVFGALLFQNVRIDFRAFSPVNRASLLQKAPIAPQTLAWIPHAEFRLTEIK